MILFSQDSKGLTGFNVLKVDASTDHLGIVISTILEFSFFNF